VQHGTCGAAVKPQCIAAKVSQNSNATQTNKQKPMKTRLAIALIIITTWSCQQKSKLMGKTIKVGESITHELEGNPTTGYTWQYKAENPEIVKITEEIVSENKDGMVGTPSKFKYKIEGAKAGSTQILFTYQRSWEKDVAPAQTDTLTVNIE
jgi:predicted secreted protein